MLLEINKLRVESIVPVSFEPTQQEGDFRFLT